jgi:hypothetical protein
MGRGHASVLTTASTQDALEMAKGYYLEENTPAGTTGPGPPGAVSVITSIFYSETQ